MSNGMYSMWFIVSIMQTVNESLVIYAWNPGLDMYLHYDLICEIPGSHSGEYEV
jgi:hypothetical protein